MAVRALIELLKTARRHSVPECGSLVEKTVPTKHFVSLRVPTGHSRRGGVGHTHKLSSLHHPWAPSLARQILDRPSLTSVVFVLLTRVLLRLRVGSRSVPRQVQQAHIARVGTRHRKMSNTVSVCVPVCLSPWFSVFVPLVPVLFSRVSFLPSSVVHLSFVFLFSLLPFSSLFLFPFSLSFSFSCSIALLLVPFFFFLSVVVCISLVIFTGGHHSQCGYGLELHVRGDCRRTARRSVRR